LRMIYQLPNGRIIEMSLEQFLEMDDTDIKELNGWLEDELGSFQQGYEEYLDGKH